MKTFSDLEFKTHPMGSGIISRIKFDNGYGASVVKDLTLTVETKVYTS